MAQFEVEHIHCFRAFHCKHFPSEYFEVECVLSRTRRYRHIRLNQLSHLEFVAFFLLLQNECSLSEESIRTHDLPSALDGEVHLPPQVNIRESELLPREPM